MTLALVITFGAGAAALSLISVEHEVQLGREAQAEVRRTTPELGDGRVNAYIDDVGRRLAVHAPGPEYPYSFSVADIGDINAFALPGGPVWVHRGAIAAARTESQLVGVMAHEVAHIARRHAAEQISKGLVANGLLSLLGAVLDDGRGAAAARLGAGVAAQALFLKFGRDDEREADRTAVQLMRAAGWDPRGLPEFFEILRERQRLDPGAVETFLSSHPSPQDRIDELRSLTSGGGRRDSDAFGSAQAQLARLPPPRRASRR